MKSILNFIKKKKKKSTGKISKLINFRLFILFLILLLIPIDALFFYELAYSDKIYPNIYVNSNNLGNKTKSDANQFLEDILDINVDDLNLVAFSNKYKVNQYSLGIEYKTKETINKAFSIGRDGNIFSNYKKRLSLLRNEERIFFEIDYSDFLLDNFLASVSAEINQPNIPPTLTLETISGEKQILVSKGSPGRMVDLNLAREKILNAFETRNFADISLPVKTLSQPVSDEKIELTKKMAEKLLNKNLILKYDNLSWEINGEELISFLSFYDTFDYLKLEEWVQEASKSINREPRDALLKFENSLVTEFQPALNGLKVEEEKSIGIIQEGIKNLNESEENKLEIELAVTQTAPQITTEKVNNLGIKELIGKGESWFPHSIAGRVHNVDLSSSKFNGVLIKPGETFSFNQILGEVDSAHGYQPAYVIKNGRTELGDGGGVCQTSTTMFRAALDAGLDIKERTAHAYRVSYYEEKSEIGTDATVYSPNPDLKFINDTPAHILIQRIIDTGNLYLSFELYGTSDGRVVSQSKSRIWDQVPPPPDVYQDDPTLNIGIVKQVDWRAWGAKTSFDWKVERNGEVIHEKTWYSNYRPWAAVYLRGTKQP